MKCEVECNCEDCENLIRDESIVIIRQNGLDEYREFREAVKCRRYGMYSTSLEKLKESNQFDDMIWIN